MIYIHFLKRCLKIILTKIRKKTNGKLIIKNIQLHLLMLVTLESLIKELALKRSFRPDIIFVDYLNICASSRFRGNANVGSYFFISKRLQKNLEDSQLKLMYLLFQRHKQLEVDLCQATLGWKIRQKVLVYLIR